MNGVTAPATAAKPADGHSTPSQPFAIRRPSRPNNEIGPLRRHHALPDQAAVAAIGAFDHKSVQGIGVVVKIRGQIVLRLYGGKIKWRYKHKQQKLAQGTHTYGVMFCPQ